MAKEVNTNKTIKKEVRAAIDNAYIILGYACENGLVPENEKQTVEEIVRAKHAREMTAQEVSQFWMAYSRLTSFLNPANSPCKISAESIISIEQSARRSITRYEISGFITLLVMLAFQIYWIIGAGFISDMKTIPDQVERLQLEKEAREGILGENAVNDGQITIMGSKIDNLRLELNSSAAGLKNWFSVLAIPIQWATRTGAYAGDFTDADTVKQAGMLTASRSTTQSQNADDPTDEVNTFKRYSAFVLETIQSYVLPILYGLLGAFTFVLRNLSKEITEQTFTRESEIKGMLRLHLGALSGLAVGWIFGNDTNTTASISSLSPLALSFIGGYSVEFVFNGIDKLIASIGSKAVPA
jgi:hypothetical protein